MCRSPLTREKIVRRRLVVSGGNSEYGSRDDVTGGLNEMAGNGLEV